MHELSPWSVHKPTKKNWPTHHRLCLSSRPFFATTLRYDADPENTGTGTVEEHENFPSVQESPFGKKPSNTRELNSLLEQWWIDWTRASKTKGKKSPGKLPHPTQLLKWIDSISGPKKGILPDIQTYRYLIDGARVMFPVAEADESSSTHTTAADFIEFLFRERILSSIDESLIPSVHDFHKVMRVLIRDKKDLEGAEAYVESMKRMFRETHNSEAYQPTTDTYNMLIGGWAKEKKDPRRASAILRQLIDEQDQVGAALPNRFSFESCLNSWVRRDGDEAAGQGAEIILLQMQESYLSRGLDTKPTMRSIAKVVEAWSKSRREDAAERAEAVLRLIQEMNWDETGKDHTRLLANAYVSVLRVYAMKSSPSNSIIADKCQALLKEVISLAGLENIPQNSLGKLTALTITAWSRSRRRNCGQRAQAIFYSVVNRCEAKGIDFVPDSFCYNAVLEGWASAGNGPRAEEFWDRMYEHYLQGNTLCQPNLKSVNSVLLAWGRYYLTTRHFGQRELSSREEVAHRAETFFEDVLRLRADGLLKVNPNTNTYNALLGAMGSTNDRDIALRGESYLLQLKEAYGRTGNRYFCPNVVTYNKALWLWSNIPGEESIARAEEILADMKNFPFAHREDRGIQPDGKTLEAFLAVLEGSGVPDKEEREQNVRDHLFGERFRLTARRTKQ